MAVGPDTRVLASRHVATARLDRVAPSEQHLFGFRSDGKRVQHAVRPGDGLCGEVDLPLRLTPYIIGLPYRMDAFKAARPIGSAQG